MRKGLTSYGDSRFRLFLRRAFNKAMGYSDDALSRPIVGIIDTGSAYNPYRDPNPLRTWMRNRQVPSPARATIIRANIEG